MVYVLFLRNGFEVCLHVTASQNLRVRYSLIAVKELLEQHCTLLAAIHLLLDLLVLFPVFCFVNGTARLVMDQVPAHYSRPTDIVFSAADSLDLY